MHPSQHHIVDIESLQSVKPNNSVNENGSSTNVISDESATGASRGIWGLITFIYSKCVPITFRRTEVPKQITTSDSTLKRTKSGNWLKFEKPKYGIVLYDFDSEIGGRRYTANQNDVIVVVATANGWLQGKMITEKGNTKIVIPESFVEIKGVVRKQKSLRFDKKMEKEEKSATEMKTDGLSSTTEKLPNNNSFHPTRVIVTEDDLAEPFSSHRSEISMVSTVNTTKTDISNDMPLKRSVQFIVNETSSSKNITLEEKKQRLQKRLQQSRSLKLQSSSLKQIDQPESQQQQKTTTTTTTAPIKIKERSKSVTQIKENNVNVNEGKRTSRRIEDGSLWQKLQARLEEAEKKEKMMREMEKTQQNQVNSSQSVTTNGDNIDIVQIK